MRKKIECHGLYKHELYHVWEGMLSRCRCRGNRSFRHYGGRGIGVCDAWKSFKNFHDWAAIHGYVKGLHIDRVDNDGNYVPENCRFVTALENNAVGRRRLSSRNKSGCVGVSWERFTYSWKAQMRHGGRNLHLGLYVTKELALDARIRAEIELFGSQRSNLGVDRSKLIEGDYHETT